MTEPIECLVSAVFCGAVCFTISAGMFAAILTKTWVVQADIKSGKIFENTPTWINDCLDIDIRLTEAQILNSASQLNDVAKEILSLSVLMTIFICQVFLLLILLLSWVIGLCCCKGEVKTNFKKFGKEATYFFKLYMDFN